ncbi:hypothetical protein AD08_4703 [Escherichia coli 1-110-08_S4_C2]|nr:hypothetical protein AD08_4703 [Escherichia coli 1-110-08_S4_C2]
MRLGLMAGAFWNERKSKQKYNNGLISLNIIKHIIIVYLPESVDL